MLITTCYKTTRVMYDFLTDFMEMLPNAHFYKRRVCQPSPRHTQHAVHTPCNQVLTPVCCRTTEHHAADSQNS